MNASKVIPSFFKNYVNFRGRASRSEYWLSALFYTLVLTPGAVAIVLLASASLISANNAVTSTDALLSGEFAVVTIITSVFEFLLAAALFLPMLSVTIRRLHDTGRSGWWYLLNLFPYVGSLILTVQYAWPSQATENRYGITAR